MNAPQQSLELETLRHRIRFLELLVEEYRLKTKRLAVQAAFYERMYKEARKQILTCCTFGV